MYVYYIYVYYIYIYIYIVICVCILYIYIYVCMYGLIDITGMCTASNIQQIWAAASSSRHTLFTVVPVEIRQRWKVKEPGFFHKKRK